MYTRQAYMTPTMMCELQKPQGYRKSKTNFYTVAAYIYIPCVRPTAAQIAGLFYIHVLDKLAHCEQKLCRIRVNPAC